MRKEPCFEKHPLNFSIRIAGQQGRRGMELWESLVPFPEL